MMSVFFSVLGPKRLSAVTFARRFGFQLWTNSLTDSVNAPISLLLLNGYGSGSGEVNKIYLLYIFGKK